MRRLLVTRHTKRLQFICQQPPWVHVAGFLVGNHPRLGRPVKPAKHVQKLRRSIHGRFPVNPLTSGNGFGLVGELRGDPTDRERIGCGDWDRSNRCAAVGFDCELNPFTDQLVRSRGRQGDLAVCSLPPFHCGRHDTGNIRLGLPASRIISAEKNQRNAAQSRPCRTRGTRCLGNLLQPASPPPAGGGNRTPDPAHPTAGGCRIHAPDGPKTSKRPAFLGGHPTSRRNARRGADRPRTILEQAGGGQ